MSLALNLKIPTGDAPDWEIKENEEESTLNSIAGSSTLYHSLKHSRNAWLTSVLPKFTSKSKSKEQKDPPQPPHTLTFISKCNIEIGPHIFTDTSIYEVHYTPEASPYVSGITSTYPQTSVYPQSASGSYSYPLTSYNSYVGPPGSKASSSTAGPSSAVQPVEPPLEVTPALVAQVNEAAASNPTLHNLLQTAASGEASMDQLKTLGFFIQSLASVAQNQAVPQTPTTNFLNTQSVTPPSAFVQASQYSPPHVTLKKPDLVLEFRENHNERFLVPREIVACEQEIPDLPTFRKDIVLYTFVPFFNDERKFKAAKASPTSTRTPTVIRLLSVSDILWETIRGWVNEEAKRTDAWESFYDKSEASSPRVYLQYRLPAGDDLISQLKQACSDGYPMKSIKPSATSEAANTKRARSRRPPSQAVKKSKVPTDANIDTQIVNAARVEESMPKTATGQKRRRTVSRSGSKPTTAPSEGGLFFINTVAPPPPEYLALSHTPLPPTTESQSVVQPSSVG